MYKVKPGIKRDPEKRWALPDRIFFGHGACHILAGTYLRDPPLDGFHAERIVPVGDFFGNHIFVTDGSVAFDYHGYSSRKRLLDQFRSSWSKEYPGWDCTLEIVDFDLLCSRDLNARKMLGPDQYRHDAVVRARRFIEKYDHRSAHEFVLRRLNVENRETAIDSPGDNPDRWLPD